MGYFKWKNIFESTLLIVDMAITRSTKIPEGFSRMFSHVLSGLHLFNWVFEARCVNIAKILYDLAQPSIVERSLWIMSYLHIYCNRQLHVIQVIDKNFDQSTLKHEKSFPVSTLCS